jgi:hypothetical protein
MLMAFFPLLLLALTVGWSGTRMALHLRHSKGGRRDVFFMLALCWSPLAISLLALLLTLSGSNP